MPTLNFDEEKVQTAIEYLGKAKEQLNGTESELSAAASIIQNARGAEYLNLDFTRFISSPSDFQSRIQAQGEAILEESAKILPTFSLSKKPCIITLLDKPNLFILEIILSLSSPSPIIFNFHSG